MSEQEMSHQEAAPQEEVAAPQEAAPQQEAANEAAPASNEPVEPAPAKDGVVDAIGDGLFENIAPTIFTGIAFVLLVFTVVGIAVPWYSKNAHTKQYSVGLWEQRTVNTVTGKVMVDKVGDSTCEKYRQYFRGAEAFGLISIFLAAGAFVFGLVARSRKTSVKPLGAALSAAIFASTLITWGIAGRAYYLDFCGGSSARDQRFYFDIGMALYVGAWALSAINLIVAVVEPKIPKLIPEALADKFGCGVLTLAAVVSFVFTFIGTPIAVYTKWNLGDTIETRVTLWNTYTFDAAGNQLTKLGTPNFFSGCDDRAKYIRFSEAFAVMSIFFTLVAALAGFSAVKGTATKKAPLIAGFVAALVTLIKFSADLAFFYKRFCKATIEEEHYRFSAGFALFVASSVMLFGAVILLGVISLSQYLASSPAEGVTRWSTFLFIFGSVVSLLFMTIGLNQPVFRKASATTYTNANWWDMETLSAGALTTSDYACQAVWERMRGGGALGVITIGITLVSTVLGFMQLTSGSVRKGASALSLFATLPQLTAWALGVSVFWGNFCGSTPYNSGFHLSVGAGLVIAAWALQVTVSVINFVVGN